MNKTKRSQIRLAKGGFVVPSPEHVASVRHTAKQLSEWGVPWPPPKDWRTMLRFRWEAENGLYNHLGSVP